MWIALAYHVTPTCDCNVVTSIDLSYVSFTVLTLFFIFVLLRFSGSWAHDQEHEARVFKEVIVKEGRVILAPD